MTNTAATDEARRGSAAAQKTTKLTTSPVSTSGSLPGEQDYVYAVLLNQAGEALVIENEPQAGWSGWQIPGGRLQADEDPVTAVQQCVLENTGLGSTAWIYLGSYVGDLAQPQGVGHYFVARNVTPTAVCRSPQTPGLRWVQLADLRYALLDGRIATVRHAIAVSLTFLTVLRDH